MLPVSWQRCFEQPPFPVPALDCLQYAKTILVSLQAIKSWNWGGSKVEVIIQLQDLGTLKYSQRDKIWKWPGGEATNNPVPRHFQALPGSSFNWLQLQYADTMFA